MADPTGRQAQRKRTATIDRATAALAELAADGSEISFQRVARHASVSRQWLYRQPQLRAQIEQLRQRPPQGVPAPRALTRSIAASAPTHRTRRQPRAARRAPRSQA